MAQVSSENGTGFISEDEAWSSNNLSFEFIQSILYHFFFFSGYYIFGTWKRTVISRKKCIVTPLPFWGFWSRDCKATITVFQSWMLLSSILLNHSSALAMNDGSLCIARQLLVGQQGLSWLSTYVTFFCVSQTLHTNCEA